MGTDSREAGQGATVGSGPPSGGEQPVLSGREAAEYVASLLEGLRLMALRAQLPFLAHLINMALDEANSEKQRVD